MFVYVLQLYLQQSVWKKC